MSENTNARIRFLNSIKENPLGDYVLYWMISSRRFHYNSGLQRAAEIAKKYSKPLLVLEAISTRHKHANDRILTFMVQGLIENSNQFSSHRIRFIPWVETPLQSGHGILVRLSKRAVAIVTDEFPTYYPRSIVEKVKSEIKVHFEAVDSNGILPISWAGKDFLTAHAFRRYAHSRIIDALEELPKFNPIPDKHDYWMNDKLFQSVLESSKIQLTPYEWIWRVAQGGSIGKTALESLEIDHEVEAVDYISGGRNSALIRAHEFINNRIQRYHLDRNNLVEPAVSGLSSWFHFGHISTIEIIQKILHQFKWDPSKINHSSNGRRSGWWGLPEPVEAFLDQIITWRELGFNFAYYRPDHTSISSIPDWAQKSLAEHKDDPRQQYSLIELESAQTDDELWNAAQRQLMTSGIMHNYLRMLWGKRILEWAPSPEIAAEWMIHLNDRWALDGRDPNSYTGIFWVLGRHDRAWGPERPIFGKVRYMSSANTARKLKTSSYLERWSENSHKDKVF